MNLSESFTNRLKKLAGIIIENVQPGEEIWTTQAGLNEIHISKNGNIIDFNSLTSAQYNHLEMINKSSLEDVLNRLNYLKFTPDNIPQQYLLSKWEKYLVFNAETFTWESNG